MKKNLGILIFAGIFFSCIISATPETDFIKWVIEEPYNFEIVIGNLSAEEITAANNLSNITSIQIYQDYEEEYIEGLIIIGSEDKNTKVNELGDSSLGNFYVLNDNLFITGNSNENIAKINQIIKEIENYTSYENEEDIADNLTEDESYLEDNEIPDDQDETIAEDDSQVPTITDTQTNTETNERIIDDTGAKSWELSTVVPAVILGIIALGIIVVFIISFLRKPN